jgi:hypothetical protein
MKISETTLQAIAMILDKAAPELLPVLSRVVDENVAAASTGGMGESVSGMLTGTVSPEDGMRILRALEDYQMSHGPVAVVYGRQVNLILYEWGVFVDLDRRLEE